MSAPPHDRGVRRRRRPARGRRASASSAWPSGSARRRSSPTTGGCSTARVELLRADAAAGDRPQLRGEGQPDAGGRPAPRRRWSTALDVASALEMRTALDTPMPATRISFAGPGKTAAELVAGRRRRRHGRDGVANGGRARRRGRRAARRRGRASPFGSTRTSRSRGRACGWAADRSSSASTPSRCRRCSATSSPADVELLGFHVFAGSQNLDAEIIVRGAAQDRRARPRARRSRPRARSRYVNLGGGFGIPYFEKDQPLDLGRVGENLAALLDERIRPSLPEARVVDRARPLHRRRVRRLRHPRGRPQGLTRQDVSSSSTAACTTSWPRPATSAR